MDWLYQTFNERSIAWLLIFTIISLASGFLSSLLTYRYVKHRELLDIQILDDEKQKRERIRREVTRWANPILSSVRDLQSQLKNIIEYGGYLAMSENYQENINPNWSISREYFMSSLPFLFGQYFSWVKMLQDELNFELFSTQKDKVVFFNAIRDVSRALSSFPPNPYYECDGKDTQVFALQQRAMGELLIIRDGERKGCMSYPEFLEKMKLPEFKQHFGPLITLLDGIHPSDDCRWKRINATMETLINLDNICQEILDVQQKTG